MDGSASSAGGVTIVGYRWVEGSTVLAETASSRASVDLTIGRHQITLTVTASNGQTASAQVTITVHPAVQLQGCIKQPGGSIVTGVSLDLGSTTTVQTDSSGCYSARVNWGSTIAIQPSRSGWVFFPTRRTLTNLTTTPVTSDFEAVVDSAIGTNLSAPDYWSTSLIFKNLMLSSSGFFSWDTQAYRPSGEALQFDSNGYPLLIPANRAAVTNLALDTAGHYRSGSYVALYDGEGDITFGFDARDAVKVSEGRYTFRVPQAIDGIRVMITRTSALNHLRRLRIMPADYEATEENPFTPEFMRSLEGYRLFRFMNWMRVELNEVENGGIIAATNNTVTLPTTSSTQNGYYNGMVILNASGWQRRMIGSYNGATRVATLTANWDSVPGAQSFYRIERFTPQQWSERTTGTNVTQNAREGVSVEVMVDLCNRMHAHPWFTMPIAASDDYVRQFATYVRDNLSPDLKPHVEWANETWNTYFAGFNFSAAKGAELGLGAYEYSALRHAQVHKIWSEVYGESPLRSARTNGSRIVRVLATQAGYFDGPGLTMANFDGRNLPPSAQNPIAPGKRLSDYADAIAIAPYFGGAGNPSPSDYSTKTIDQLFDLLQTEIDSRFQPGPQGWVYNYLQLARSRGLDLLSYEGGQHLAFNTDIGYLVGSAQSATLTSVVLESGASSVNEAYTGQMLTLTTGAAAGLTGLIASYDGATRRATLSAPLARLPEAQSRYLVRTQDHYKGDVMNRHPRMAQLYSRFITAWKNLGLDANGHGTKSFVHFINIEPWGRAGNWGSLEYYNQPLSEMPKAQALYDLRYSTPIWW